MTSMADKFIRSSKLKGAGYLSKTFEEPDEHFDTNVPVLNLVYSGWLNKGPTKGITSWAGKSRTFKTLSGLITCKAYLDADPDMMLIFYDSEGGASQEYFESVGIDPERVLHFPIMNIEDLKFDMMDKLEAIKQHYNETKEYSKFVWMIDSVGNLASVKEVQDAVDHKSVADMTRAKQLKGFYRIITPYFTNYNMKLTVVQHTYDEIGGMGAPKQIMSGGQGGMLSSNEVIIVGRRQIKDGATLNGWNFMLNIEKSRNVREKAKIPFQVTYDEGLDRYTGLLDIALEVGWVAKPKLGWFTRPSVENDKNWRRAQTSCEEFWEPLLNNDDFQQAVHNLYSTDHKASLDKTIETE